MGNTFGFIGTGNMGGALAKAAAKAGVPILLANRTQAKAEALAAELDCRTATAEDVARLSDFVFLGVKPQMMRELFDTIGPVLASRTDSFVLVSMAAGLTMEDIRTMAGAPYPVIRIMPNTPVAVGSGVVMYDATENVSAPVLEQFCEGLQYAGMLDHLPEHLIDAGSAVAGCGPAFAAMFIEALADGGVACGLPRAKALEYAAQMLAGTAKLAIEIGQHPAQMKDAVCSPGGATIAGVNALEAGGFRASAIDAVKAAYKRTKELRK